MKHTKSSLNKHVFVLKQYLNIHDKKHDLRSILVLLTLFLVTNLNAQQNRPLLIPYPMTVKMGNDSLVLKGEIRLKCDRKIVPTLSRLIRETLHLSTAQRAFSSKSPRESSTIWVKTDKTLGQEAYGIEITRQGIYLTSATDTGLFYALQTLRQITGMSHLFAQNQSNIADKKQRAESEIHNSPIAPEIKKRAISSVKIPCLSIKDQPRYDYRGLMIDVARYFLPAKELMRIIDIMGELKLNKLHLHLTDDNGWRIAIDKYPRLTQIGAWRVDRQNVPFPQRANPKPDEPTSIGGFYTHQDIRQIVAHATQRHIEVIPEIDIPAHSNAALAAYPRLACDDVKDFIGVLPGLGGDHASIILCAGKEQVFDFLKDVFDEILNLFPSQYIHIGGDEAQKTHWKQCKSCQKRIKEEGLKDEEELQSYFMNRVSRYLTSKGKTVIGWDEVTNSERISPETIIMGWRGKGQAAIKAATKGFRIILTPAQVMYLIRYQGPQWFEPLTYFGNNTLKDIYDYEPDKIDEIKKHQDRLLGIQASLWTEFCNSPQDVQYLLFPRTLALAEIAWSQKENRDWERFLLSTDNWLMELHQKGIRAAKSMFNIQHHVTADSNRNVVTLECIRPDIQIRYTTDDSMPSSTSPIYEGPISITQTTVIKAATFQDSVRKGEILTLPINRNLATGATVKAETPHPEVLSNGVRGSEKQSDFEWTAFDDAPQWEIVLTLPHAQIISTLTLGYINDYGMGYHSPRKVEVFTSDDGRDYRLSGTFTQAEEKVFEKGIATHDIRISLNKRRVTSIKILLTPPGKCPKDHVQPLQPARMSFDEVLLK